MQSLLELAMVRMNVDENALTVAELLARLERDGQGIELARGGRVVAHVSPAAFPTGLAGKDLKSFFDSLPDLGDDREAFAKDIESARDYLLPDADPWAD